MKFYFIVVAVVMNLTSNSMAQSSPAMDVCEEQKSVIGQLLNQVDSPGIFSSRSKINEMCEKMFGVGEELFVLGLYVSGGGWGDQQSDSKVRDCYESVKHTIKLKKDSIHRFVHRCQSLVDKHPLLLTGGCTDDQWCDKYSMGARALGFEFNWESSNSY